MIIKNKKDLASNEARKIALDLLEAGLTAIQPENILEENLKEEDGILFIKNKRISLGKYERVFLIGFGKGSAEVSKLLEKTLGNKLFKGFVIDTVPTEFKKINFTLGTHPLPSKKNVDFTLNVLEEVRDLNKKDLVIVIICGGGSALFEAPESLSVSEVKEVFDELINSGATIEEINIIRKHLSKVKGGGLAKHLYPAKVVSLIFSDVPGNDLSVIASGPTVIERSTTKRALAILNEYKISKKLVTEEKLIDLPKDPKYFDNVTNILMLSNMTALEAIRDKANELGQKSFIYSDRLTGDAKKMGKRLIDLTPPGKILIAGGETTIKVMGKGKGGRNQALVLASLPVPEKTLLLSFDSDGTDYYYFGGAIGDEETMDKAKRKKLDPQQFLKDDNSFAFFEKTGDGIFTDKLKSNVADIIMVLKI